jgi:hypothetical protein
MFVIWRKTTFHAFGWITFILAAILSIVGVVLSLKTNEHLWYLHQSNIAMLLFGSMGIGVLIVVSSAFSSYLQLKRTIFLFFSTPEEVRNHLGMELQAETLNSPMAYPQMKITGSLLELPFDIEYFQQGGAQFVQRLYLALPADYQSLKKTRHYLKKYGKQGVSLAHFGLLKSVPYRLVEKTAQTWVVSSLDSLLKIAQEEQLITLRQSETDNSTL